MKNKEQRNRIFTQAAALTILGAAVCAVIHATSGISMFARVDKGDSSTNSHTKSDISQVMHIVRSEFRNLNGCVMTNMRYDEAESLDRMKTRYTFGAASADDVIVIKTDFTTSDWFSGVPFAGHTQTDYNWTFKHTPENGWEFCSAGYC